MWQVKFSQDAIEDIVLLQKHCPQCLPKLAKLIDELKEHPRTGTGKVERLKGFETETWSRRINHEHRLAYRIHDDVVEVIVIAAYGHYSRQLAP